MTRFEIEVPITTRSLNKRAATWHAAAEQRRIEREAVLYVWADARNGGQRVPPLPVVVTVTRCSAGKLDRKDNLPGSLKGIRDEVTRQLGLDDDEDERIEWVFRQETAPRGKGSVRIVVEPRDAAKGDE